MTENKGLTSREAEASRQKHGSNKMTAKKDNSLLRSFLENLSDPVIRILIASLIINLIFTFKNINWIELSGIGTAILLATTISTLSEYSSRTAFEKLNKSAQVRVKARRDGIITPISADNIVVGDVILLCAGDKICADGLLISGKISLDQSALTGESKEMEKAPCPSTNTDLSPSSKNSCLRGSLVSDGEGEMLVLRVGDATFLGKIAGELQTKVRKSPLKLRLTKLASQISKLGYIAAALIAVTSLFSATVIESDFVKDVIISKITDIKFMASEVLHSITLALTVVIMAVPEGLPMMIAVVLSSNVKRMLNDNVLVRKQTGIEAAGSMNILFTDKTGTLTKGKMSVEGFITPTGQKISSLSELKSKFPDIFTSFCQNSIINTSALVSSRKIIGGNATERALLDSCKRYIPKNIPNPSNKNPFNSNKKYSSAILDNKLYVKGAPDVLKNKIEASSYKKLEVEYAISEAQNKGKRVIYLCEGEGHASSEELPLLCFVCAVIIADPVRHEAKQSVEILKEAGIDVVMITGDGILTAKAIAEQSGIINSKRKLCLTHSDIEKMSNEELSNSLDSLALLCRALPSDKSRLVRISQEKELVVGMTGDGINDAPALRISDVGFAMGSGAEIAKDAGDVVILDNNLASIVKAVLYGRNIFKSIRKFLVFQLTMNFSSALVCMLGPLFGFETPITITQMLWVNMIMDTLGGIAFAGEAPEGRIMRERPKRRNEPILNSYMAHQIFFSGSFSVLVSMLFLKCNTFTSHFRESKNNIVLLSAFFALFIFLSVVQCINSRTDRLNLFNGITKNTTFVVILMLVCVIQTSFVYFGGEILRTTPLSVKELSFTLLCAITAIPFEFLRKVIWRFSGHSEGF